MILPAHVSCVEGDQTMSEFMFLFLKKIVNKIDNSQTQIIPRKTALTPCIYMLILTPLLHTDKYI